MDATFLSDAQRSIARRMMSLGVFEGKEASPDGKGFELKHGGVSPYRINVRIPGAGLAARGAISPFMASVGRACIPLMHTHAPEATAVCGVPYAALSMADMLYRLQAQTHGRDCSLLFLEKHGTGDSRYVYATEQQAPTFEGMHVVLADDVITRGGSKIEAAHAVEAAGGTVELILVIVDREEGGRQALEAAGYNVVSLFTTTQLITFYHNNKLITPEFYAEIRAYLRDVNAHNR